MDPGEVCLSDLIAGQNEEHKLGQNDGDGDCDPVDDDASQFTSTSLDDVVARDVFQNFNGWADNVSGTMVANRDTETSVEQENLLIFPLPEIAVPPNFCLEVWQLLTT